MILPPLRRIICTGTEMLYPNAKLFSILTTKNMMILGSQRIRGMARGLTKVGGFEMEKWVGHVNKVVMTNWRKVMRRPGHHFSASCACSIRYALTAIRFFS